ncbi:hypothetical protein J2755_000560 [Methanohalophilus levihalophilus]|uniref:hypothetical protein n=1 Tax=Methanohalophilus levihalophilus TaxID=1431282 RepID=UPI001AEA7EE7|nr:hypothetical protein [Methanohalophilus levihalophilus]MBP2029640.1 hypothetical protein [Methanohalophilus levihalophilus]
MSKNMCVWKKEDIINEGDEFKKRVVDAKYYCKNCGRVSNDMKYLCMPGYL